MDLSHYGGKDNKNAQQKKSKKSAKKKLEQKKPVPQLVPAPAVAAVVLDENAQAHDSDDEFGSNFSNIVIPKSHKSPVSQPKNGAHDDDDDIYSFINAAEKKENANASVHKKKKKELAEDDPLMHLDEDHDNVKQLSMFGFTPKNVRDAWRLMKQNAQHQSIVPDHGPLFMETMLDYLNKVQKERSKSMIMSQYNQPIVVVPKKPPVPSQQYQASLSQQYEDEEDPFNSNLDDMFQFKV